MRDKVITILRTAAVLIIIAVFAAWVVYGTGIFDEILKRRISRQLEDSYGISFEGDHISDRSPIVPDFDEELEFTAYSEDGIYMYGTCDWKGTILTESFVHYYYSPVLDKEIEDIIDGCLEEYLVVEDFRGLSDRAVDTIPRTFNSVASADEYTANLYRYSTFFRVYVRSDVSNSELRTALNKLRDSGYKGNVYFVEVRDEWFDFLKDSKISCHPKLNQNGLAYEQPDKADFYDMIDDPSGYIRGIYIPQADTCEVVGYPK